MQQGGFAVDGDDGGLRLKEEPHLVVEFHGGVLFAGGAESGEPGVPKFLLLGLSEKLDVLGIAPRPAAFDVMHAEGIEFVGDAEFVGDREVDAFALGTVAQGRVVDFDLGFHDGP